MPLIDWAARMKALKFLSSPSFPTLGERSNPIKSGHSLGSRVSHSNAIDAEGCSTEENLKEAFEERAAIMEFDGGLSRREAERQAFAIVYGAQGAGGTRQRENRKT